MGTQTVAEYLVDSLAEAGVRRMYGVVGDSLNPITDAVRRKDRIRWVHVRHEEAGAFAAAAEAQLTGQLTVCVGSCGPGHVHLINGVYDAHRSMAPVLVIASHIPSTEIGTEYFQETHPERLFEECSNYCELVSNPKQMARVLPAAIQKAVAMRGVSVIVLPGDVAGSDMPGDSPAPGVVPAFPPVLQPAPEALSHLAEILNAAENVTLLCGFGCRDAHRDLIALAGKLNSPVAHAYRGKQFIEYDNPFNVGMTGLLGYGAAYKAMHGCDVLVMIGTDFPYEAFLPVKPAIVQIDEQAAHLGRRCKLALGICADAGETMRALLPLINAKQSRGFLSDMLDEHRDALEKLNVYVEHVGARRPIHPEFVAATLNELAAEDAIFTVDTGMCNVWHARYIRATKDRRMLASYMHGSMANALPQAIGAQLVHPERQVISMSGDGGLAMLMGELLTVLQCNLPIKIVLFNNSALGMVKLEMEVAGMPDYQTDLKNPNFAKMAEAIGFKGIRIEDPADVRSGLAQALAERGPVLVDVVTNANALSMPPHVTLSQLEGFSLAMSKVALSGHVDEVVSTIRANLRNL